MSLSMSSRGRGGRFTVAILACLMLLLRGAVADPPVTVPDRPTCRVFCFRITDIRCDDDVENRYHFEFEVLNWSNAWAGGVHLKLSGFSDTGIEFVPPQPGLNDDGIDFDGRPLKWEDIDLDGNFEYDIGDLEDTNTNGILDAGEDMNANNRLDNDPIPGNKNRPNVWIQAVATKTEAKWDATSPASDAIPFIDLVGTVNCTACIEGLPHRDGSPSLNGIDGSGNVDPLEWVDNGDNVQDGFVLTIDGMEPGKVAHINWFLLGAGDTGGSQVDPEDTPSGDCRRGLPNQPLGDPIGTVGGGNAYGFGLVSLFRLKDKLPKGTFKGQTGFAQTATEFFDGVYNVPPSANITDCGSFGMEFTPGTTCDLGDFDRESSCPPDVQAIPGQSAVRMPRINGHIGGTEWDGATIIPLHQASRADKPSLSTAWIKVNCVTNKWYVRTEINREEGVTHMVNLTDDQFVKLGITSQLGGAIVDGSDTDNDGEPHFAYVTEKNDANETVIIGWEACFHWDGDEQPNFMKIHTQVWATFSESPEGETSATLGTNPSNMFQVCVCGGRMFPSLPGNCEPIDTKCGGDPHFSTWSGEEFSFHGACDLVLIKNPTFADGLGMHVHARTKKHKGGRHENEWSDMESIAVQIGKDVFEARGAHEYWINGQRNAQLPALVGGYQVSLQQLNALRGRIAYVIHLGGEKELRIKAFDDIMWVQIKGQQSNMFEGSNGLFGNFETGNKVGRDGTVINNVNQYGNEWQVRPDLNDPVLFQIAEGPQYPEKCAIPNHPPINKKDLMDEEGVRVAIAKKACAHAPKQEMEDCVFDVVTTHNVDVAEAY